MNGQTILTYLDRDSFSKQIPKHFLYPDTSIYVSKYPSLVIINTDSSKGPGEHWCSAYFDNETVCEYFDPLGFPPKTNNYDFTKTLFPFCNHIIFNKQAVQSQFSSVCGHHCLYFIFLKSRHYSLNEIISKFYTLNTNQNDKAVLKFIQHYK